MTVCVGIRVPGLGAVVGSDGRVSACDEVVADDFVKVARCGTATVAAAGVPDVLEWLKGARNWPHAVRLIKRRAQAEWIAVGYCATRDRLMNADQTSSLPVPDFYAVGSGASVALGALAAMRVPKTLDEAERAVRKALRIASARVTSCGGKTTVRRHEK
jgi:ATP-dependent protease HslVU (ClpYQ) peptidase subunit